MTEVSPQISEIHENRFFTRHCGQVFIVVRRITAVFIAFEIKISKVRCVTEDSLSVSVLLFDFETEGLLYWKILVPRRSWRGGPNLISQEIVLFFFFFFSNPTIPACVAQIEIPFPFFYCFFHESQSQCTKSHFSASKKGKSQLPFYPFATLFQERLGPLKKRNHDPYSIIGAELFIYCFVA